MHWSRAKRDESYENLLITAITLSPAIDVTYRVDRLRPGHSHRVKEAHKVAGGKALNVARVLKSGGHPANLILPIGGHPGDWLRSELDRLAIEHRSLTTISETRTCVTVMDGAATVFNQTAPKISQSEFEAFLTLIQNSKETSVGILSGSLPFDLEPRQLLQLLNAIKNSFPTTILDTSGRALLEAAKLGFDLLKPNREELLEGTGLDSVELAADHLVRLGAKRVLVSLGEAGAKLFTKDKVLGVQISKALGNPTGAGDAMVAISSWSLEQGLDDMEILKNGAAAGLLAVLEPVAGQMDWKELANVARSLDVRELK